MPTHLPVPKQIRDLFADLLDRDVTLTPAAPQAPGPSTPTTVAVFVDDHLRISAVMVLDIELSAYAGAAIGLVPVAGATRGITAGVRPLGWTQGRIRAVRPHA